MERLRTLYTCRREGKGNGIPFVPRPEQEVIFRHLIETPTVPAYIIKSRRLGLSTGLCTFQADAAVFESGWRGVLIDQKQDDATKKMVEIIRFSIDNLDPAILRQIHFDKRNDSELRIRIGNEKESQDSVIYATTGSRGGDCSMLHVSEWGPIAATDAPRSKEIRSGAFPAARLGRRVVETTWMGGKGGDLWELIQPILEKDPNAEGVIYFFPWHEDPAAIKLDGLVTKETEDYFRELSERLGKKFDPERKKWWAAKKLEQGMMMSREYPSTLDEAFRSPIEGAIYAKQIDQARTEGRVIPFEWDRSEQVHTFWDLGSPKHTRCTYVQFVGREIHLIDHDGGEIEMTPAERVAYMNAKGYYYGQHFLPHDAAAQEKSGVNFQQQLVQAGLTNTRIIKRCHSIWPGINKAHEILPRCVFHSVKCETLISALEQYAMKKSTVDGMITDVILKNWTEHSADSFRMLAQSMLDGMLKGHSEVIRQTKPTHGQPRKASAGKYSRG